MTGPRAQVAIGVAEAKRNLVRREKLEALRRHAAQPLGGAEAIHQQRFAASVARLEAMQELQARDRIAVWVVGVGAEGPARKGEVIGGGLGDHVEDAAVVGLADVTEPLGDSHDLAVPRRHAAQERETETADQPTASGPAQWRSRRPPRTQPPAAARRARGPTACADRRAG